jgi:hypothetical protein
VEGHLAARHDAHTEGRRSIPVDIGDVIGPVAPLDLVASQLAVGEFHFHGGYISGYNLTGKVVINREQP